MEADVNVSKTESASVSTTDFLQFVCFKLAEEQYAIDITKVQEVLRVPKVTPVPQMPDFVLGVVNIRGKVVPVFDLHKKFKLPDNQMNEQTKILVANIEGFLISFVIDEILDNIKLDMKKVDPTPNVKMKIQKECIRGIGVIEGRMIIILDLDSLNGVINQDISAHKTSKEQ